MDPCERALFLSLYGEALSPDYLTRLVGQYVRKADIGRTGSCHLFRHACCDPDAGEWRRYALRTIDARPRLYCQYPGLYRTVHPAAQESARHDAPRRWERF